MRAYNDFNKLMDMILYVFPKYLVKFNGERNKLEDFRENKLLEEFIERVDFKELREYLKNNDKYEIKEKIEDSKEKKFKNEKSLKEYNDKHKDKDKEQSKFVKEDKDRDKVRVSDKHKDKDKEQSKFIKEDKDRDKVRVSDKHKDKDKEQSKFVKEDKGRDKVRVSDKHKDKDKDKDKEQSKFIKEDRNRTKTRLSDRLEDRDKEQSKFLEKELCKCCNNELRYIFQNLVHKKVSVCIEDSISGIISNASVVSVEESIVKLRTKEKNIVIIPIKEIVGVRSDEIVQINFIDSSNSNTCHCHEWQDLSKYFRLCIGKSVIIRTKGEGEFKYTSKKKITSVGRSFVVLDNNMVIFNCKIVSVEKPN